MGPLFFLFISSHLNFGLLLLDRDMMRLFAMMNAQ